MWLYPPYRHHSLVPPYYTAMLPTSPHHSLSLLPDCLPTNWCACHPYAGPCFFLQFDSLFIQIMYEAFLSPLCLIPQFFHKTFLCFSRNSGLAHDDVLIFLCMCVCVCLTLSKGITWYIFPSSYTTQHIFEQCWEHNWEIHLTMTSLDLVTCWMIAILLHIPFYWKTKAIEWECAHIPSTPFKISLCQHFPALCLLKEGLLWV